MARNSTIGTVYLLHFERPLAHARHYLGWAIDAQARVDEHLAGDGSRLVRAVVRAGIHVELVRTWEGVDRNFERSLKRRGNGRSICPICKATYDRQKADAQRARRRRHAREKKCCTPADSGT